MKDLIAGWEASGVGEIPTQAVTSGGAGVAPTVSTPVCRFEDFLGVEVADRLLDRAGAMQLRHVASFCGEAAGVPAVWDCPQEFLQAPVVEEAVARVSDVVQEMLDTDAPLGELGYDFTMRNHQLAGPSHQELPASDGTAGELRPAAAVSFVYTLHRRPRGFTGGTLRIFDATVRQGTPVCAASFRDVAPDHDTIVFFPAWAWHQTLRVTCPSGRMWDSRFAFQGWIA